MHWGLYAVFLTVSAGIYGIMIFFDLDLCRNHNQFLADGFLDFCQSFAAVGAVHLLFGKSEIDNFFWQSAYHAFFTAFGLLPFRWCYLGQIRFGKIFTGSVYCPFSLIKKGYLVIINHTLLTGGSKALLTGQPELFFQPLDLLLLGLDFRC